MITLGTGVSGTVFLKDEKAVKMFNTDKKQFYERELEVLQNFQDCKFIVKLLDFDKNNLFLVLEKCKSDLYEIVSSPSKYKKYTFKQKFHWVYQMTQGLNYIHSKNFVHCDFKLENVLLTEDNQIRICDFGFCTNDYSQIYKITEEYVAPEIINKEECGPPIDMWALGVAIFTIGNKEMPYYRDEEILNYEYYPKKRCPKEFRLLVEQLFVEQSERLTADDVLCLMDEM